MPCNWAEYVKDVTVPDNTVFASGSTFTKTWRLKNIGTCTWTGNTDLIFDDGDQMREGSAADVPTPVKPGETVDLTVNFVAPNKEGDYRGYWLLRSDKGDVFGVGDDADEPIWVDIKVVKAEAATYNFITNICNADWRSDAGSLPCSGGVGSESGYVTVMDDPVIEKNYQENELALATVPQKTNDGFIRGQYPEFEVQAGQHFKAVVGCLDNASDCDVIFRLNYRAADDSVNTLWENHQEYDGKIEHVDVDLSPLAGQKVRFILYVSTNGPMKDDYPFWLVPRISN